MPNIYTVTDEDVADLKPNQVGPNHWEFPDGFEVYVAENEWWVEQRIEELLKEIKRLESIRLARMAPEHQVLLEKVDELCEVMHGVDLKTYQRGYSDRTKHLFKAARYVLSGGTPTRRSHPTYVIPVEYASDNEVREVLFRDQSIVLDELASGELEIYATSLPDDTYFLIDAGYGDEESNLRDFAQPYTPTPEEVMRALQGPPGPPGPMGPQGNR